ncbi:50S ribosomal protein L4 [candidate division CSSED10-310 bacterium]|uniref:Large ribosomal subunit protein uL4 n=1 Tax=candidate division CSSED10-310 bacterium TaxID=2855610 RepID=A0ABV6YWW4_UNCC1
MPTVNVVDTNLNKVEEVTLSDSIFNQEPHHYAMQQVVRAQMATKRRGTAKTKSRGEVTYTNAKLYRQKGTGRARAGSERSPIRVGGGVIFGPMPRSFAINVPRKVRRIGIISALSQKFKSNDLIIVEHCAVESGKTRDFVEQWQKLVQGQKVKTLFVIPQKDEMMWRSTRNVKLVKLTFPDKLNVYDLLYYQKLVITREALTKIEEVYG